MDSVIYHLNVLLKVFIVFGGIKESSREWSGMSELIDKTWRMTVCSFRLLCKLCFFVLFSFLCPPIKNKWSRYLMVTVLKIGETPNRCNTASGSITEAKPEVVLIFCLSSKDVNKPSLSHTSFITPADLKPVSLCVFTIQFPHFRLWYECCKRYTVATTLDPSLLFYKTLDLISFTFTIINKNSQNNLVKGSNLMKNLLSSP